MCYPIYNDPDSKLSGCLKGANMVFCRGNFRGLLLLPYRQGAAKLNALLHEYGEFIIGRMGIPYRKRGVSVIAIAMDAPQNTIAALSGKIGGLVGVSVKTAYSGVISKE